MGYLHISNLYRPEAQRILEFKRVYAMEKVHGTSANVSWDGNVVAYHSGGEKYDRFRALFDHGKLVDAFKELGQGKVTVFGEAYGGKQQGMSHTYGNDLRFIVFDIKIGDCWLDVPTMDRVATRMGFEVVPWRLVTCDLETLDGERDMPSEIAVRRSVGTMDGDLRRIREGIVIRPPFEITLNNGERLIAKHKGEKFSETTTPRRVDDPEKLKVLAHATEIANEWVTPMRLEHVLDKLPSCTEMKHVPKVMDAMIEDVYREALGEIVQSEEAASAIRKRTAVLYKEHLNQKMRADQQG